MTESDNTYDPPQDTGDPDAVETDPAALSSAEDLDEDRLRLDPQEAGIGPARTVVRRDRIRHDPVGRSSPTSTGRTAGGGTARRHAGPAPTPRRPRIRLGQRGSRSPRVRGNPRHRRGRRGRFAIGRHPSTTTTGVERPRTRSATRQSDDSGKFQRPVRNAEARDATQKARHSLIFSTRSPSERLLLDS